MTNFEEQFAQMFCNGETISCTAQQLPPQFKTKNRDRVSALRAIES